MKLMILGASTGQLQGILKAKALGHQVMTCDYIHEAPGHAYSDEQSYASTFDADNALTDAKKWQCDGVMTMGTDQPVLTAAIIGHTLNLPTLHTIETARAVTHKAFMKERFVEKGMPTVDYRLMTAEDSLDLLDGLSGPYVLKPVDSQGQRGIFYVEDQKQIPRLLPEVLKYSRDTRILVESYYPHQEVTLSGWVAKDQCHILSITDRVTFEAPEQLGICLAHRFPSRFSQSHGEELIQMTKDIRKAFAIHNGPIYFQFLIGDDGIKINEIACRIGGAYEGVFIPEITGFDMVGAAVNSALGQDVNFKVLEGYDCLETSKCVSVQLFFADTCQVSSMPIRENILELDGVLDFGLNYAIGDTIGTIDNATCRAGYMVVVADSPEDLKDRVEKAFQLVKIIGSDGEDHLLRSYDII